MLAVLDHRKKLAARLTPAGSGSYDSHIGGFARRAFLAARAGALVTDLTDEQLTRRLGLVTAVALLGGRMLPGASPGRFAVAGVAGWMLGAWLEEREQRRAMDTSLALPDALDRLAVCTVAGMSVEAALRRAARSTDGLIAASLQRSIALLDAGASLNEALAALIAGPGGEAWSPTVAAIERASKLGSPVSAALVAHAREQRGQARAVMEAKARAAPVKVVFPLVFCFLPAFLILAIGPVAMSALRTLAEL